MKNSLLVCVLIIAVSSIACAQPAVPAVAVHIEKHAAWECAGSLPDVGLDHLATTYDGVGKIDAFVVFYRYGEARGLSFGLKWPDSWGAGDWKDCGDLRMGNIEHPGDMTSIVWLECIPDTAPLIAGWITLTVNSPGAIEVIPASKEGVIAILDCDPVAAALSEAMISLKAGAGGTKGDPSLGLSSILNRRWLVRPDSSGDAETIDAALRLALPGDTVMVAGGTYHEHLTLRHGVVLLGSWDADFTKRDISLFPSVIDAGEIHSEDEEHEAEEHEHHAHGQVLLSTVQATLGADSSTVVDGFVITGGRAKQGGALTARNGARPILRNLIIHSNSATYGGAIFCHSSSPTIDNCLIVANEADLGGAIYCTSGSSPVITNTTIAANHAQAGAAIAVMVGSSPTVERSIIADHPDPSSIYIQDVESGIALSCCNTWNNEVPQYGGIGEEVVDLRDNTASDPRFVDPAGMDFTPGRDFPGSSLPECGKIGTGHSRVPLEDPH